MANNVKLVSILLLIAVFGAGFIGGILTAGANIPTDEELVRQTQNRMVEVMAKRPYAVLEIDPRDPAGFDPVMPYVLEGWDTIAILGSPKDGKMTVVLRNPELPK